MAFLIFLRIEHSIHVRDFSLKSTHAFNTEPFLSTSLPTVPHTSIIPRGRLRRVQHFSSLRSLLGHRTGAAACMQSRRWQ